VFRILASCGNPCRRKGFRRTGAPAQPNREQKRCHDPASRRHTTCGLHCFGYDTVKIVLLLVGIIFVVTVARSFVSLERTRALLGGRRPTPAQRCLATLPGTRWTTSSGGWLARPWAAAPPRAPVSGS
jgi:hypothetical protein